MPSRSDQSNRWFVRTWLASVLFAAGVVGGVVGIPGVAVAQNVDSKVESLVDGATDDYDNLEIQAAKKKLKKAIRTGKNQGASDDVMARAYVILGVVEYGATRKKPRARKAFKAALKLDADATIPDVYETPTLAKIMKKARKTTDTSPDEKETDEKKPAKEVEEFTHEPISSAQAGEALTIEALVPTDMAAESVYFVYKRYRQKWKRIELEAKSATRFAKEIPGYKVYTSQISYYIEAKNPSGDVVAESGSKNSPHMITVLGSASFDHEKAKKEYMAKKEDQQKGDGEKTGEGDGGQQTGDGDQTGGGGGTGGGEAPREGPSAYLDLGVGTGIGLLTHKNYTPTANPNIGIDQVGLVSAILHTRIGGGYIFPGGAQLGAYIRFQFLPAQNFERVRRALPGDPYRGFSSAPCFGTGLPGDCMFGLKFRYFFSEANPVQFFSSIGAGFGLARHWLRLKEIARPNNPDNFCTRNAKTTYPTDDPNDPRRYCYRFDTVRPGWIHVGVGGGVVYQISETFSLMAEAYLQILFPNNTAPNLDINIGPQFRF